MKDLFADEVYGTELTLEHRKELDRVSPKEPFRSLDDDGDRPMQMPYNWSVDDMTGCMIDEMDMPFSQVHQLLQDRDLMYKILTKFQENLVSRDWMEDLEDAIKDQLEKRDNDE